MYTEHERPDSPDGLDLAAIDALIRDVYAELAIAPRPTSALLDESAAERRQRRIERRTLTEVVRTLPTHGAVRAPSGEEAA
jgi:hypothetical protein